ncbi:hypothetical protein MKEN_01074800 [Mycena kentingensis (nom. inval.)]|nr:hypothetical protein MKEN_01074800 [Mycena kentingensis (nom. inval.)]
MPKSPRDTGHSSAKENPSTDATSTAARAFLRSLRPLRSFPGSEDVDMSPPAAYVEALTGVKSSVTASSNRRSMGQRRRWERERGMREGKEKENRPRNTNVDSKRGAGQRARRQRELAAEIRSLQRIPAAVRTAANSQTIRRRVERAHKMLDADHDCDPDSTLENQLEKFIYDGGSLAKYGPYVSIDDPISEGDTTVEMSNGTRALGDGLGVDLANSASYDETSGSDDVTTVPSAVNDTVVGTSTGNLNSEDTLHGNLDDEEDGNTWANEDYSMCEARVTTSELQVPFELIEIDFSVGQHKSPEYLKFQPFGQIPYIDDDGFILFETRAISRYLAAKYPRNDLIPTEPKANALFEQAAAIEQANFDPFACKIGMQFYMKRMEREMDQAQIDANLPLLEKRLEGYEAMLGKTRYLAGEKITLADLFHLPYAPLVSEGSDIFEKFPNVNRWLKELTSRPSWLAYKDGVVSTALY